MKFARPDYQGRIVDLANKIPSNEPVFLLRSRDICAPAALHSYLTELVARGASKDVIAGVNAAMLSFAKYQKEHRELLRLPDIGTSEDLPFSDSPALQKALNEVKELTERNEDLSNSFNRVVTQLDEYTERYSELKKLEANTAQELQQTRARISELELELRSKNDELTHVKFNLREAVGENTRLKFENNEYKNSNIALQGEITTRDERIGNLEIALRNEIDGNAV